MQILDEISSCVKWFFQMGYLLQLLDRNSIIPKFFSTLQMVDEELISQVGY